jgi:hypothetical protein
VTPAERRTHWAASARLAGPARRCLGIAAAIAGDAGSPRQAPAITLAVARSRSGTRRALTSEGAALVPHDPRSQLMKRIDTDKKNASTQQQVLATEDLALTSGGTHTWGVPVRPAYFVYGCPPPPPPC